MKELGKNSVIEPFYKSLIVLVLIFMFFAITWPNALFARGSQDRIDEAVTEVPRILLGTEPQERPAWVDSVPQSATEFYFIGSSLHFNTASDARDAARENARNQVLRFYGEYIERQAIERVGVSGITSDTLYAYINREDELISFAQNIVSQVGTSEYFTQEFLNTVNNQVEYVVYVLSRVNRQVAENTINDFASGISRRYTAMIRHGATLRGTLDSFITVLRALEDNPLHRMVAYHEGTAGRVGLHGYVLSQINELVNSVSFTSFQNRIVQRGDVVNTLVQMQSSIIPSIGNFNFRVIIQGFGLDPPFMYFSTQDENSFPLSIFSAPLEPGRYMVRVEMLMNEITGRNARYNIVSGFSLEVRPLAAIFSTRDEMEAGIKNAVDTLAFGLESRTRTRIGLFALTGTDIPTGLSRYLSERVTHFAINNHERRFNIIREIEEFDGEYAIINGFFTRRGNNVEVTLELKTYDGRGDGSQFLIIEAGLLARYDIAIEPENIENINAVQEIVQAIIETEEAAHNINIQAFFNSQSMTFLHRDELQITLLADTDCYFKVIHIDAENNMRMIYPNSFDTNNFLRANIPRAIFETASYMLYEPYGAGTIIIIASSEQFENIEQQFIAPWTAATTENIRSAVRGNRPRDIEPRTFVPALRGAGEVRHTITILKPHEKHEFSRPDNMREMVESLRSDVLRQGGIFEGNETSGLYFLNGIRGSYRIPRNNPNVIQFAFYNEDISLGGLDAQIRTRGRGFNFYIERPRDITQTIQMVRTGIEESGGMFSGNEEQGDFSAQGVIGRYRVADRINITITRTPFLVPNFLIENEIRNFFSGH